MVVLRYYLTGGIRATALMVKAHYRSREKLAKLAVTQLSPTKSALPRALRASTAYVVSFNLPRAVTLPPGTSSLKLNDHSLLQFINHGRLLHRIQPICRTPPTSVGRATTTTRRLISYPFLRVRARPFPFFNTTILQE